VYDGINLLEILYLKYFITASLTIIMLSNCSGEKSIRIHNATKKEFTNVAITGTPIHNISPRETSEYVRSYLPFGYAIIKMTIDGIDVNGQSLNFGSTHFTHEVKIKNIQDRHLAIKVIKD